MNKIKIDNYYKPESKTLRLDEVDYTIIPNSDIKPLLDKLQQENRQLRQDYSQIVSNNCDYLLLQQENKQLKEAIDKIQMIITDMQLELIGIKPYHSYVVDGNIIRNMTKNIEDILKEVSE